jgi:hypothetical protein
MSLRSSLDALCVELSSHCTDFERSLQSLESNLRYASITSASAYNKCLKDLDTRLRRVESVLDDCLGGERSKVRELTEVSDSLYKDIQRLVGTAVASSRKLKTDDKGENTLKASPVLSSPDAWTPNMQRLLGKYGPAVDPHVTTATSKLSPSFEMVIKEQTELMEANEILSKKYADNAVLEENTLELKSQVIFSGSNSVGNLKKPEPVHELDDLPPVGSTPHLVKYSSKESLEEAISVALQSKCEVTGVTPAAAICHQKNPASLPRTANTPKVPKSVPEYLPVDEGSYSLLPSFIRGQISLDDLNQASKALHTFVCLRSSSEETVTFNAEDVRNHSSLPPAKGKVLLNALAKLEYIQLKVIYGQGTVYFFKCSP